MLDKDHSSCLATKIFAVLAALRAAEGPFGMSFADLQACLDTVFTRGLDCSTVCLVNQSLKLIQSSTGRRDAGSRLVNTAVTEADSMLLARASFGMFMNGMTKIV